MLSTRLKNLVEVETLFVVQPVVSLAAPGIFGVGPWVEPQQRDAHRIHHSAAGDNVRLGCRNHRRVGDARGSRLRSVLPLSLIVRVEKSLVFHDRTAQRASELVVVEADSSGRERS